MTEPTEHDPDEPNPAAGHHYGNERVVDLLGNPDHRVLFHGGPLDGKVRDVPPLREDPSRPGEHIECHGGQPPPDPNIDRALPGNDPAWLRVDGRYRRRGHAPDEYGTWHYFWVDEDDRLPKPPPEQPDPEEQ